MNTLLFVDDSSDLREIMELMCQSLGTECICVPSMSAVLERVAQVLRTDLAILDVNLGLGEPSGIEIYRWLKGQNYRGKIVFLSGHTSTDPQVVEATRISDVDFFRKPLGFDQIEALILGKAA
jgi:DNA-binding NtrC family response regulator